METNIIYAKIFLDKRIDGVVQPNGSLGTQNNNDFYINIPITKTYKKVNDYVNIEKDPFKTSVQRQKVNPYFIEFAFFETIGQIKTGATPSYNIEDKTKLFNIFINK